MTTPPFVDPKRWIVLRDLARQWDDRHNRGAGAPRPTPTNRKAENHG